MILLIDIDAVLRDFVGALRAIYDEDFPDKPSRQPDAWDMLPAFPAFTTKQALRDYWTNEPENVKKIFLEGRLVSEDIPLCMETLRKDGHRIHLVTAQPTQQIMEYTLAWLWRNEVPFDDISFLHEKWRLDGDVFLDDAVHNLMQMKKAKPQTVCVAFDQLWNQEWTGIRFNTFLRFTNFIRRVS